MPNFSEYLIDVKTQTDELRLAATEKSGVDCSSMSISGVAEVVKNISGGITPEVFEAALSEKADIEYVDEKFNGANKAVSFANYSAMISSLNALGSTTYSVGQNIMIVTLSVPDLWISDVAEDSVHYTYSGDSSFVTELYSNGGVRIGHYTVSALETQKVDMTDYLRKDAIVLTLKDNGAYTLTINKG